jgi:hypothetical protein
MKWSPFAVSAARRRNWISGIEEGVPFAAPMPVSGSLHDLIVKFAELVTDGVGFTYD